MRIIRHFSLLFDTLQSGNGKRGGQAGGLLPVLARGAFWAASRRNGALASAGVCVFGDVWRKPAMAWNNPLISSSCWMKAQQRTFGRNGLNAQGE